MIPSAKADPTRQTPVEHSSVNQNVSSPLPLDADLLCGHCHQNLRGVSSDRCPECGHRFDRAHVLQSVIPWEQRKQIGRFKAYWRTVRYISFRAPKVDSDSITLAAAKSFRRWTVGMLIVTFSVPIIWWKYHDRGATPSPYVFSRVFQNHEWPDFEDVMRDSWFFGTSLVAAVLWLIAVTGIGPWFAHPKRLSIAEQKRGVAASLYACAPLAWITPLTIFAAIIYWTVPNNVDGGFIMIAFTLCMGGVILLNARTPLAWITPLTIFAAIIYWMVPKNVDGGLIMIAFTHFAEGAIILIPVTPFACWIVTALLIRRATHSNIRAIMTLISLPIVWLILAVVIFVSSHILVNVTALLIHWFR